MRRRSSMEDEVKKLTGYELMRMAGELIATLEESGGVLDEESEAWLDAWFNQLEDKIGAYWAVTKRIKSEAEFLKKEADRLTKRRRALEKTEQRIKSLATELLREHERLNGESKIKRPEFTASLSRRKSTVITNEHKLLEVPEYCREVVSVDKLAISSDLKAGKEIAGAHLETVESVTWR